MTLLAALIFSWLSGQESIDQTPLLATFSLIEIPANMPERDVRAVSDMRQSFFVIDSAVAGLRDEDEDIAVNIIWLKCVFYARYFEKKQPSVKKIEAFAFAMIYEGGVDWLTVDVRGVADEILQVVNAALYCGTPNATHGRIGEMLLGDPTPFQGADFVVPIKDWRGYVTSEYGVRSNPTSAAHEIHTHNGIDIAPASETEIYAAQSGLIVIAENMPGGYGNYVVIYHGGQVATLYAHCAKLFVKLGDTVAKGQLIATVGSTGNSTGPHLHFEVIEGSQPVNPRKYLP